MTKITADYYLNKKIIANFFLQKTIHTSATIFTTLLFLWIQLDTYLLHYVLNYKINLQALCN